jgi:hypothetical protein
MPDRVWLFVGRAATGRAAHFVGGAIDLIAGVFVYRRIRRRR